MHEFAALNSFDFSTYATSGFTIALWYRYTAAASENDSPTLIEFGKGSASHIKLAEFRDNQLSFGLRGASALVWLDFGTNTLARNLWEHIAVVVSPSAVAGKATVVAYSNGALVAQSTDNTMTFPAGAMDKGYVGRAITLEADKKGFIGYIDSLSIIKSAATQGTVNTMMEFSNNLVIALCFLTCNALPASCVALAFVGMHKFSFCRRFNHFISPPHVLSAFDSARTLQPYGLLEQCTSPYLLSRPGASASWDCYAWVSLQIFSHIYMQTASSGLTWSV
jgi:hypothetical protein